jgi:hypothetical protein
MTDEPTNPTPPADPAATPPADPPPAPPASDPADPADPPKDPAAPADPPADPPPAKVKTLLDDDDPPAEPKVEKKPRSRKAGKARIACARTALKAEGIPADRCAEVLPKGK